MQKKKGRSYQFNRRKASFTVKEGPLRRFHDAGTAYCHSTVSENVCGICVALGIGLMLMVLKVTQRLVSEMTVMLLFSYSNDAGHMRTWIHHA